MAIKKLGFYREGLPKEVNFPLCLAPMVGLSHGPFRALLREYMPAGATTLWPSEMLNSRRIPHENLQNIPEAVSLGDETFWVPQILANEKDKIEQSLPKLYDHGARGIDINMGCPVKKALRHNYGVALMGDADYAAEVVETTVAASPGPVSVKLRGSPQAETLQWTRFVKKLEEAGASWLCLHPRTAAQKRKGRADYSQLKTLRDVVTCPTIANGDVQTSLEAIDLLLGKSCDMVMVGRALTARPWLFWQLGEDLGWPSPEDKEGRRAPRTPEEEGAEYGESLLRLIDLMNSVFPERLTINKFRFHVKTSHVWLPFGHHLMSLVTRPRTVEALRAVVRSFFQNSVKMRTHTDLRQ